ncbi:MAG TPA: peptidoglycan DD-metalloendopeptidase family protein [Candidatus Rifleibacterium sp.]|nr:peptidoglycan DD-metalloendopeptidase family protein [Candidatus Rifleibacterium sp.]HPT44396.1 peptidoglycan DD-metalloendopeptidase family protein [Candidatus Rifleibacterium sp.]
MPQFLMAVLFILASLAPTSLCAAPRRTPVPDTGELQNEIESINVQLDYLQLKVSDSKKKTRKLEADIKEKKTEVEQLQSQIEQLNLNQAETITEINKLEAEAQSGRQQLKTLLTRFRSRLVQLHKIKQGTLLSSIVSAKNLNSFLNRYHMVKYLLESDKDLIQELKKHDLQQRKLTAELQTRHQHLEAGKAELDEKQKKLDRENSALSAMLSTVLLEKKLFLAKEKSLAAAREQLEQEISRAESVIKAPSFEEELHKPSTPTRPIARPVETGTLASSAPEAAKVMQFAWPVEKSRRMQTLPTGDENSAALQIKVTAGSEIMAAARGKVLYKGTISGLGDVVIIGHQRGFSSVYGLLDNIWVGLNQIVDKGETIGQISGGRNQALHFEIRFGGKKQPPLTYLPSVPAGR